MSSKNDRFYEAELKTEAMYVPSAYSSKEAENGMIILNFGSS